jgi:protein-disulfide isomerase
LAQSPGGNFVLIRADASTAPGTLATINGRAISTSALDPVVASSVAHLNDTERAERKRALEEAISLELFALEGRPRRLTAQEVAGAEVVLRTKEPTPAEVRKVYQDHIAEFGGADLTAARPQIVAYLRAQQAEAIMTGLAQRLRAKYPVTLGTDINDPKITPDSVLATIAGKPMLAGPLLEKLKPLLFNIRSQVFMAARQALDQLIYSRLVLAEASRRSVEPESIVRSEVTDRLIPPSETEINRQYDENKALFDANNYSREKAREVIVEQLQDQQRARLEADLSAVLRKQHTVVDYLVEPEAPILSISVDDDPARGDLNAPVTVVMFTDFQCSACSRTHPILQEIMRPYGNRIRFVVRDFPLQMHPDSRRAAEAAGAANAQGKFFQYIELLYTHQDALGLEQLKQYASQVGLDRAKFDLALARGTYGREIIHDLEDGAKYGITGTPAIFVNGKRVVDIRPEGLQRALDQAFGGAAAAKSQ